MSEREEALISRVEALVTSLERTKNWYRTAAIGFAVGLVTFIALSAIGNYRLNRIERGLSQAVSIKAFDLVNRKFDAHTDALVNLVSEPYKDAALKFQAECKNIYDDIFMFSTEINLRGEVKNNSVE